MASAAANDFIGIAESVRWVRAEGAEPEPPVGFGPGQFTLPEHYVKPLERSHPHERDSDILFKEKPHIYMGPLNTASPTTRIYTAPRLLRRRRIGRCATAFGKHGPERSTR